MRDLTIRRQSIRDRTGTCNQMVKKIKAKVKMQVIISSDHHRSNPKAAKKIGELEEEEDGDQIEDGYRMTRVCDRLIEVFLIEKTKPEEWRKLLAFSKEWTNIRDHFFKRCKVRAEQEIDPKRKGDLLKLSRKLKEVCFHAVFKLSFGICNLNIKI